MDFGGSMQVWSLRAGYPLRHPGGFWTVSPWPGILPWCGAVAYGGYATVAGPRSLAGIGVNASGVQPLTVAMRRSRAAADDRADLSPRCRRGEPPAGAGRPDRGPRRTARA